MCWERAAGAPVTSLSYSEQFEPHIHVHHPPPVTTAEPAGPRDHTGHGLGGCGTWTVPVPTQEEWKTATPECSCFLKPAAGYVLQGLQPLAGVSAETLAAFG